MAIDQLESFLRVAELGEEAAEVFEDTRRREGVDRLLEPSEAFLFLPQAEQRDR